MNQFFTEHRIICKHQFGFRTGLSTSDAIVEFLDGVYDALVRGNDLISVFLDLSRSFHTANHRILLDKAYYYGVRGLVHEWFESYLHNREQYVSNGEALSSLTNITSGVPQGVVLAPLLFSLYIKDMYLCCPNLQLIHYADDTTAYVSGAGLGNLVYVVNQELKLVRKWLQSNRLSLNIDKTSYMIFGRHEVDVRNNIHIANVYLQSTEDIKFLGITIDCKLYLINM